MTAIEFFYDIVSPYSYLASTRVEALAADLDVPLTWRPFFLGGVMKATGNQPPATLPARAPYLFKDLQRWVAYYGIPFQFPSVFPTNTLTAMRALAAAPDEHVPDLSHALFHAYWADGRDPSDPDVLAALVGADLLAAAQEPATKAALKATSDEAVARGAFGAPTLFWGDEMFFGNDRLPFLEQHVRAATAG